jgi:hypothetical protein
LVCYNLLFNLLNKYLLPSALYIFIRNYFLFQYKRNIFSACV